MSQIGYASITNGSVAVGTVTGEVLAANPARLGLVLSNVGTVSVSLALGTADAVVGEGLVIPAGEQYEMARGHQNVWSGAIQGIASVDDVGVAYSEGA